LQVLRNIKAKAAQRVRSAGLSIFGPVKKNHIAAMRGSAPKSR
jgi:hypothetical protein